MLPAIGGRMTFLDVQNLSVSFSSQGFIDMLLKRQKTVRAVDGINLLIQKGEILCLVGESGCGKTTCGKAILGLVDYDGSVIREGKDIAAFSKKEKKVLRTKMQIIFQDPYESLNPKHTIFDIVAEPLEIHYDLSEKEKEEKVIDALEDVGLRPASEFLYRYPHELSGGQRQRVVIAGALILNPEFIVADEPVSMLDVSIRAEILKLMIEFRGKKNLTYLFITHDLSLAWVISDRIAIMYLGKILEIGPSERVLKNPKNPYTKALISVIPIPDPHVAHEKILLQGEPPDPSHVPPGCRFHPRCPFAFDRCRFFPEMVEVCKWQMSYVSEKRHRILF
jgi:oligopeptide/dipeptide ABC transporter ATP-binding protein